VADGYLPPKSSGDFRLYSVFQPICQIDLSPNGGLEMADYDFSKPAPDRSHRVPAGANQGSGVGGLGFILVGTVVILVVLYAVFGGAAVPLDQDPSVAVPDATAPLVEDGAETAPTAVPTE
jgi:hypothetical protein